MSRKGENIYKRKDGRWEGRYIKDRTQTGKAIYGYVYGKTYGEVRKKKIKEQSSHRGIINNTMFYNEWLDYWLENRKIQIKESTYVIYYLHIEKHIKPYFENKKMSDITNNDIQNFMNNKLSNGRLDQKGGLSYKTVKELVNIIKLSLRSAIKNQVINEICLDCKIPSSKVKLTILNKEEFTVLVQYLKDQNTYLCNGILLMICTGIRIGELCALQNKDIHISDMTITIQKTLQRITDIENKKTKIIINDSKTLHSIRKIPIPNSLIKYININDHPDNYFLTQTNKYMEPRTFRYAFKRIIKKLQLSEVSVHSLRHLFATNCIELGFDYNCLSEILGHASPSTTMNLYVHSKIEYKQECMNRIEI